MFAFGFRPFFLLAGIYAGLVMALWLAWLGLDLGNADVLGAIASVPSYLWHGHEMLFGYTAAVIAGFLLTAVPNWTGAPPLHGLPLAALAALWLAGRLAMWLTALLPPLAVALVDLAFLPALALVAGRPLVRARAWRNTVFLPLLGVLFAANLLVHLELLGLAEAGAAIGHLLAVNLIAVLIAIVGGRIVPAFTSNWLAERGERLPIPGRPRLERLAIAATALVLVVDLVGAAPELRGWLAIAAAVLHLARLAGWRSRRVLGTPILWVLHLGYAWLALAFACKGLALITGVLSESTALHAFTAGAIGTMTLGVMTRAALGHSGRPLVVSPAITAAYLMVSLGAVVRVAGPPFAPELFQPIMVLSGGLWTLAFALFAVTYWPILTGPRVDRPA